MARIETAQVTEPQLFDARTALTLQNGDTFIGVSQLIHKNCNLSSALGDYLAVKQVMGVGNDSKPILLIIILIGGQIFISRELRIKNRAEQRDR